MDVYEPSLHVNKELNPRRYSPSSRQEISEWLLNRHRHRQFPAGNRRAR
ncbi:hypothetical protein I546_4556 [Mycobacterium kansasii 732]|nr:hypothetical protein I546_4556 [Mycobacterium kansasii 732]